MNPRFSKGSVETTAFERMDFPQLIFKTIHMLATTRINGNFGGFTDGVQFLEDLLIPYIQSDPKLEKELEDVRFRRSQDYNKLAKPTTHAVIRFNADTAQQLFRVLMKAFGGAGFLPKGHTTLVIDEKTGEELSATS